MKQRNGKSAIKRITACVVAAVMIALSFGALFGCSLFDRDDSGEVEFSKNKLELSVGDKYDLSTITFVDYGTCVYSSSAPSVASVSGSYLTAKSVGSAIITARIRGTDSRATLRVSVLEEDSFTVNADGSLVQTLGNTENIVFTPAATGFASENDVAWYVNGTYAVTLSPTSSYTFTPTAAGEFEITAVCGDEFSVSETVRVYYDVDATCDYDGEAEQMSAPYSAIKLTAWAESNSLNPETYTEWFVDGVRVYGGSDAEYTYYPTAGMHTVTVRVNGKQRAIGGKTSLNIVCYGSVVPSNISVSYDNVYPHIYVSYDAVGDAAVEITSPTGSVVTVSQTELPYLFGENVFDAGDYIELCAKSSQGKYKLRVKSLGDGGILTESDYSDYFVFTQLPHAAESYIGNTYYDKDHYVTSDAEYINLFEYYVISRKKTSNVTVSFDCYLGYESTLSTDELWDTAFNIGATSGSYSGSGITKNGNVLHTSFRISTVNAPTKQTYSRIEEMMGSYSAQLHSNIPHINYDSDKYRSQNHVFPIDECERTQSVAYTDELYLAAENNTRPVPVSGSAAETVYERAREILRQIVTDDMTDAQKAHAIYDWVMWQVTYDTPATEVNRNGEAYSAYYLEGVFGNGQSPINGVTYYPYAVCDGMSKAYSLMCNIEGIPCMRVSGMAGSSVSGAGGHAWNKVCLDGEWYIVDCTWGDSTVEMRLDMRMQSYECAFHDWLFVTDEYAEDTHYEPYMYNYVKPSWGDCKVIYAPETSKTAYDVYKEMTYNGVAIDCRLYDDGDVAARYREIVTQFINAYTPRSTVYVPGRGNGVYSVNYESLEIKIEEYGLLTDSQYRSIATAAVKAVRPYADVEVVKTDSVVLVLVRDD